MISTRIVLPLTKKRCSLITVNALRLSSTRSTGRSRIELQLVSNINRIGIPRQIYIPQRLSNLPSPITSPILFFKCLAKRIGALGLNTVLVVDFRRNLKPKFLVWKNAAIEQFVLLNTAFAKKNLHPVRVSCSNQVYDALNKRLETIPKNVELEWKLLKFNAVPKIVSFMNIPAEDGSSLCVQIIYKFNTKQRLVTLKDGEVKSQDKDLIEYLGFNIDPYTDEVCLSGSLFESDPKQPLYVRNEVQPTVGEMNSLMSLHGDIYRSPPKQLQIEDKKN